MGPVIDYIQKGGFLMWPILVCSIISIGVFAERLFFLHRATIHVGEFLKGLSNLIRRRNFAEALHESAGTPGPVARVIHAAILRHDGELVSIEEPPLSGEDIELMLRSIMSPGDFALWKSDLDADFAGEGKRVPSRPVRRSTPHPPGPFGPGCPLPQGERA